MLHFSYGVMGSSKSAMLLMQHYNHMQLGHYVVLIKPAIDTRIDSSTVYSRVGLRAKADIIISPGRPGNRWRKSPIWPWIRNSIVLASRRTSWATFSPARRR